MKRIKLTAIIFLSVIVFSGFFPSDTDIYFRISKSIETFGKIYKEISLNYVEKINPEEFILSGVKGMLTQLDPYTNYIDSKDQKDLDIITTGKYGGIGLSVSFDDDKVTVVDLIEGYSAQRQGVRIGDVIVKINDKDVTGKNNEYLSTIQKGEPGTSISLTIKRDGNDEPLKFELVREAIEINNIYYYGFIPENGNNAYIKLSGFTRTAGNEIKNAIEDLNSKKEIKSIVLDLRGNPGGLLEAAVDVCEKFLKKGDKVVSVIGRDTVQKKDYFANEEPVAGKLPLAILVDNGSASASEIVAGAIQDHDRGIIVGETTFGKGLVQSIIPLTTNSSLKMTTARYYTPSGRCIQKISYSDKNKVFENQGANKINQFFTDRKRKVYSAGGIAPDSVTEKGNISPITIKLLAEGMVFKFATHYFNSHPDMTVKSIKKEQVFNDFIAYLSINKFTFTSRAERGIDQLRKMLKEGEYPAGTIEELNHLAAELEKSKNLELNKNKKEITDEIIDELLIRMLGRKGMIKEAVKTDRTYGIALTLLGNKDIYNKLLKINE